MNESKQRKIGAILSYVIIALNMLVGILYTPLLTSKLGQSEYGLYQYVNSIIGYLTILDLGLGNAIIIYISRAIKNNEKEKINKLFSMFLTIFAIIGIVASCIGLILYFNASNLFSSTVLESEIKTAKTLLIILTVNIAISFPSSVFSNTINAHEKFILIKGLNIFSIIIKPMIMIPLLFLGFRSITLVTITTLVNILIFIINYMVCRFKLKIKFDFSGWRKKMLKEIFSYSIWIALTEIVDKVNWSVDNFLIGKIMGTVSVSIYSIASQLNQIYISTSTAISGVMLPKIAKLNENKDNMNEMNNIWIKTGHIQLYIVGLILSGYIIFGRQFIILWVGKEYYKSYYVGIALMLPMIVSLVQNVAGSILRVKNKHKFMSIIYALMSIINIFVSIPLIKRFGEIGAALGTGISLIIGNIIIKNIYFYKSIKLDVVGFFKKITPLFIVQTILTIIGILITRYICIDSWVKIMISIVVYSIIYANVTLLFMNEYEKNLFKKIKKKIFKTKLEG